MIQLDRLLGVRQWKLLSTCSLNALWLVRCGLAKPFLSGTNKIPSDRISQWLNELPSTRRPLSGNVENEEMIKRVITICWSIYFHRNKVLFENKTKIPILPHPTNYYSLEKMETKRYHWSGSLFDPRSNGVSVDGHGHKFRR